MYVNTESIAFVSPG